MRRALAIGVLAVSAGLTEAAATPERNTQNARSM